MAIQKLGKVTTVPKGDYVSTERYERLDIVLFDGSTYMCRKTCTGIEPESGVVTEYWMPYGQSINIATTGQSGIVRPDGTSIVIKDPVTGALGVGDADYIPMTSGSFESNTIGGALEELDTRLDGVEETISDEWDNTITYAVGQYCLFNNRMWKCLVQNKNQEPTEGAYWTFVKIGEEFNELNNNLAQMKGDSAYHNNGDVLSITNVPKATIVCIYGSGNSHRFLGVTVGGNVLGIATDGFYDADIAYNKNTETLTLPTNGHYYYAITK